jgi:hypothetical protein
MNKSKLIEELFSELLGETIHGGPYDDSSSTGSVESIYGRTDKTKHDKMDEEENNTQDMSMVLKLPKFRISETWGTPGTDDRVLLEKFTSKIKGSTLQEKINSLQSFVSGCDQNCVASKDVSEILGNMVFLDSLASVVYDFNDKTGGFLFESIVAVLLGGNARQVPTPGGKNQAIEDLLDSDDTPLSLKFFFGGGTKYIHGSYNNLNKGIEKYQQPVRYIVALKNRKHKTQEVLSIDFFQFDVGNENYPGDFDGKGAKYVGKDNGYPNLTTTDIRQYKIGTLDFGSRQKLQQIAQQYASRLGTVLQEIYQQIDELSQNVHEYFLDAPNSKTAALKAQNNAKVLKKDADELS